MSTIDQATQAVDTSKLTPAEPSKPSAVPSVDVSPTPGVNPFLRSPLPPINAVPDTLRQFYTGGIPQYRVAPPPPTVIIGPQGSKGDTGATGSIARTGSPTAPLVTGVTNSGTTLPTRQVLTLTTASLASGANQTGTIPIGKTFTILEIKADTGPCRLRLYSDVPFRTADLASARNTSTPPTVFTQHGVILDVVFDSAITQVLTGFPAFTSIGSGSLGGGANVENTLVSSGISTGDVIAVAWDDPGTGAHTTIGNGAVSGGSPPYTPSDIMTFYWEPSHTAFWTYSPLASGSGPVYSPWFSVPVGATQVGLEEPTGNIGYSGTAVKSASSGFVTVTPYPILWVCSPEALGSDCSSLPGGSIAYVVDNLHTSATVVTVEITILKEEM